MGAAHVGAKYLLTNPDFVKWLAKNTTVPVGALPAQISALEQIAARQKDPDTQGAMKALADQLRSGAK